MPNRREPVIIGMISFMYQHRGNLHSLSHALYDWNVIGHYLGLRLSEWAQIKPNTDMIMAPDGLPMAFTFLDMTFLGSSSTRITQRFTTSLTDRNIMQV